ncbi:hypothetical protein P3X46_029262 [Hevea brasiliensis]|uniref:ARC6 IMS domain-containing protein n=1 Tax=Hevea brasiliensis TaxID=3981 RepID=A0ABQ9KT18_HEVBR|nr:uncharacterized protein LOC110645350 [Hevea brasiliensis]XP_021654168.2 uncharacterized protein LOC110645350 [Hevea brasiliensis]XP_057993657.1 uncharacterized protein LOC110645350 [Hevea brasiliensis]KAJ9147058.1 hypothetical protein P3X46_029262 [Hevea brasiliensis]KAJ9147059.1 hypothetical protein P3X46_029262 [Hevea brasiliensis]
MPTFTAIALDRLLEPGASKSVDKTVPSSNPVTKSKFLPKTRPVPNSTLERKNSTSATERKVSRPQISPALYATPETTPLPDSPSSFPPSPYIINHKRRGPRLLKGFTEDDVATSRKTLAEDKVNRNAKNSENSVVDSAKDHTVTFSISDSVEGKHVNGAQDSPIEGEIANGAHETLSEEEHMNGVHDGEIGSSNEELKSRNARNGLVMEKDALKLVALTSERDGDPDDFFDPQESMSYTSSTDGEDNSVVESSVKLAATTPVGEFYDAWEELSTESERQTSIRDIEAELREIRLNLLMELEKQKQVEETLFNVQNQWQRIRQQLSLVGLTLPAFRIAVPEDERSAGTDLGEELCQQVYVTRFVSESIGRGIAKAEAEMEKETQIEAKNFEIGRLWDRLHYYEAVNREMSQRNQEAVEVARRNRQVRKRRQRWVWGSIAAVITLGTAALAWSYLPSANGSSSSNESMAPGHDDAAE